MMNKLTVKEINFVNLLIMDIANFKQSTFFPMFPMYRCFDLFEGHSFANGITGKSNDGNNQESFSEDFSCWYNVYLYGKYTKQKSIKLLGKNLLKMNVKSIKKYWLMNEDNDTHPSLFRNNKVVGILFNNKADYCTWFGLNTEFIHGIQMMPYINPLKNIRSNSFVKEEWEHIKEQVLKMDDSNPWKSVLILNYSQIDDQGTYGTQTNSPINLHQITERNSHDLIDSFEFLKTAILDDGMTRAYTLYMAYVNRIRKYDTIN